MATSDIKTQYTQAYNVELAIIDVYLAMRI